MQETRVQSWKIPWRRTWQPTPVFLPGESHGQRSLVGYSPWDHWKSDTTEQLHFHFSLSCIGEGNGNIIPGTGEPGGLPSLGSHRVGHDWSDLAAAAAAANDILHISKIFRDEKDYRGNLISEKDKFCTYFSTLEIKCKDFWKLLIQNDVLI